MTVSAYCNLHGTELSFPTEGSVDLGLMIPPRPPLLYYTINPKSTEPH